MNSKYEITNIPHEKYPFLHRIRALRDIGHDVKAGDLGGFVESESNLSFEDGDEAWIYDNAIACERSYVNKHSQLRDSAVIRNTAYISEGARLSGESKAEDDSYVRGGQLTENARVCGKAMILAHPDTFGTPVIRGRANVYGKVMGAIHIGGDALGSAARNCGTIPRTSSRWMKKGALSIFRRSGRICAGLQAGKSTV